MPVGPSNFRFHAILKRHMIETYTVPASTCRRNIRKHSSPFGALHPRILLDHCDSDATKTRVSSLASMPSTAFRLTLGYVHCRRAAKDSLKEKWSPKAGDLIVSNWVSWIEILWLVFRFNPTFVLPVAIPPAPSDDQNISSRSPARITGRKTGTGSANIALSSSASAALGLDSRLRERILGFRQVSLLRLVAATGRVPPFGIDASDSFSTLEDIRKQSSGPLVVFPECTTSNGRALLKFANIFEDVKRVPINAYEVYIMCVR